VSRDRTQAIDVLREVFGRVAPELDLDHLDPGAELLGDLDLDSMDFLNIVVGVHDETGLDIPESDYPQLATLDGFVAYLVSH